MTSTRWESPRPRTRSPTGSAWRANVNRYLAIWDHPKPVIAAVHGYCIAGATQMCVFADLTIVAEDARIGEPALPLGGGYIAPLWAPLVGPKRAKELAFLPGNAIDGRTAVEWGWANHAVPRRGRRPDRRGDGGPHGADPVRRPAHQEAVGQPHDGRHGCAHRRRPGARDGCAAAPVPLAAFAEKRKPVWTGR
ncbi:enoyl-CoA hydratase/isomerase family protein [Pseudonocardia xishanensis]|uniref:enoyl-CoA hydratase/isomerase family protein n=1 Tax=Pseudonocardia xishanensis TaxID=630995 RepID=UPI003CD0910C